MSDKKIYIYSTLAAAVNYQTYATGGGDVPVATREIVIQGGANIPDKYMRTPDGSVVTPVSEEELEALRANPVFALHEKNGFIKVSEKLHDTEKVAADMTSRDESAPLVDSDFDAGKAPIENKADETDDKRPQTPKPSGRRA